MSKHEEKEHLEETKPVLEESQEAAGEPAEETASQQVEGLELTPESFQRLQQDLEAAQAEAAENLDGWQRSKAEFINYKKRMEREQAQIHAEAAARVIARYLDVLDDLDRAMAAPPQDGAGAEWAAGIELIHRKLANILDAEGVTRMEAEGQPFDPNLHEAISMEESPDHESGQVIEVIKHGYLIGDRVLRPATVRVAS